MKYKIMAIFFGLLASWLSTAAAAQTYDFTVPLNISNLPEKVRYFRVECTLLLADDSIVGNNFAQPSVNPGTGQPMESQVRISVPWDPQLGGPPTHYKCSLYFPGPDLMRDWVSPSTNPDADVQPAPGTPLVEVVSGNL
jgi:hypothetical protein